MADEDYEGWDLNSYRQEIRMGFAMTDALAQVKRPVREIPFMWREARPVAPWVLMLLGRRMEAHEMWAATAWAAFRETWSWRAMGRLVKHEFLAGWFAEVDRGRDVRRFTPLTTARTADGQRHLFEEAMYDAPPPGVSNHAVEIRSYDEFVYHFRRGPGA